MKGFRLYCNVFWLLFSLIVCIEAYRVNLGEFSNPGPGFFPFCVGLVMLGLSLAALFQSMGEKGKAEKTSQRGSMRWWNIVIITAAIITYALTLEKIGFLINTFLFVGLLLKVVEPQPWKIAVIGGLIGAVSANLLFNVIFQSQIPSGILGF